MKDLLKAYVIIFFLLFFGLQDGFADYFVDSQNGNDSNVGSQAQPWKTISKVNSTTLSAGTKVLFKRGGTYRGLLVPSSSGTSSGIITYGAYGSGAKPVFLASYNRSTTQDWVNEGNSLWSTGFKETSLGSELLPNSTFDNVTSDWYLYLPTPNVTATYSRTTTTSEYYEGGAGAKIVAGSNNGTSENDIQFSSIGFLLKPLTWYKLSFKAKASVPFSAGIKLMKNGADYTSYVSWAINGTSTTPLTVAFNNTFASYTIYIRTKNSITGNARFTIPLGNKIPDSGKLYIDSYSMKECINPEDFKSLVEDAYEDCGNIIFTSSNPVTCAKKVWNKSDLDVDGEFWYDYANMKVFLYSGGLNPATKYTSIELARSKPNIYMTAKAYLNFEDLDLRYGGGGGFLAQGYSNGTTFSVPNHITIKRVDVFFVGGTRVGTVNSDKATSRAGNGIGFWNGTNNVLVEGCRIAQVYDSGISPQGSLRGAVFSDLKFINNIIDKCEQSFEIWQNTDDSSGPAAVSSMSNVFFDNNTCRNAGGGWSHTQRPDVKGVHLLFYDLSDNVQFNNVNIRNNIFDSAADYGIYSHWAYMLSKINIINYNCWNLGKSKSHLKVNYPLTPGSPLLYNWPDYRNKFSRDGNSLNANPLLLSNGAIPINSPAKNIALTLSHVSKDFVGNSRQPGSYDIGAFEFTQTGSFSMQRSGDLTKLDEIDDDKLTSSFKVYPNPCFDHINIVSTNVISKSLEVTIATTEGRIVEEGQVSRQSAMNSYHYSFKSRMNTGNYVLKVSGGGVSKAIIIAFP